MELWAHAYGNPDEALMSMPPFSQLAAQSKRAHQLINAAGTIEFSRLVAALRADADAIASVMTEAQRRVIAPTEQTAPLSQLKTAVWNESKAGEAALKAEQARQRAQVEAEWGPQRWDA